jgi:hypothetical protein
MSDNRPQVHDLKCWPEFFEPLWARVKTFEIRLDDRGYQVGDTLTFREWSEQAGYTGRWISANVSYVLGGCRLPPHHVCMSIVETDRGRWHAREGVA